MTTKDRNTKTLKRIEDTIFRARHTAADNNDVEMYGKLDDALVLVQHLSMGLMLERDDRNTG